MRLYQTRRTRLFSLTPFYAAVFFTLLCTALSACNRSEIAPVPDSGVTDVLTVITLAGNGSAGFVDAADTAARFLSPSGVAADLSGNVYVADAGNHAVRKISPSGIVTTLAGNGSAGFADGTGNAARFNFPTGLALDRAGNLFIADAENRRIRKVIPAGIVTTVAGTGAFGTSDGAALQATFSYPVGVATDSAGNVFIADQGAQLIRKLSVSGVVTTVAGTTVNGAGVRGSRNGAALEATFNNPGAVAAGRGDTLYIADVLNNSIRRFASDSVVTLAGSITSLLTFYYPYGVAVDSTGRLYVADRANNRIQQVSKAGAVSTLSGRGQSGKIDGDANEAMFSAPEGVAVGSPIASGGAVYVADTRNHCIRKIFTQRRTSPSEP